MHSRTIHIARLFAPAALVLLLTGCNTVRVADPLTHKFGGSQPEEQLAFWHALPERPVACNDEAFHALLLYADSHDDCANYDSRVATLKERRMLAASFHEPAEQAITRGTLAVAIVRLLEIRGGWALTLLGPTPRYATRELIYRGIYPLSSPSQTLTGNELLGIIGKIEDAQETEKPQAVGVVPNGGDTPPIQGSGMPR